MADISGYTRYMTANAKTLAHSQTVITELVTAIVQEVELPLTVAKLEGDAVFMYCRKNAFCENWGSVSETLGRKMIRFFELFNEKAAELSRSVTCTCSACTYIEKLRLKLIVHSGQALFHRIVNFEELAGVDVILLHRLLKNSVQADQYLLVTEAGSNDVKFPDALPAMNRCGKIRGLRLRQNADLSSRRNRSESLARNAVLPGEGKAISPVIFSPLVFPLQRYELKA